MSVEGSKCPYQISWLGYTSVPDVLDEPPYRTTTHHPTLMVHWWLLVQSHPKPGPINPKKEQDPTHSNEQNAEKK
jgi:hypothetical protein